MSTADCLMITGAIMAGFGMVFCLVPLVWGFYLVHLMHRDRRAAAAKERWRRQDLQSQRAKATEIEETSS